MTTTLVGRLNTPLRVVSDEALMRISRDSPGVRMEREEDGTPTMSPTPRRSIR
jgi:hypothetical protein